MSARSTGGRRFITLEGPDGAGKSTHAARLARSLEERGHPVCVTREPGGTRLGERIRDLVLSRRDVDHGAVSDALLFNAARSQLVAEVIRPALEAGAVVICDRFADSTLAYQGYGEGLELDALRSLGAWATGGLTPDLTLLLDVPEDVRRARRPERGTSDEDRFEAGHGHDAAFHERVRRGFLALAAAEPDRWRVIDATPPPDEVARRILEVVTGTLDGGEPLTPDRRMER